ncbi:MAG: hypothetical protein KBS59_03150 [Clostridiales bacterium]|nr:hypothetical protein [Clostridiales bacterium]
MEICVVLDDEEQRDLTDALQLCEADIAEQICTTESKERRDRLEKTMAKYQRFRYKLEMLREEAERWR